MSVYDFMGSSPGLSLLEYLLSVFPLIDEHEEVRTVSRGAIGRSKHLLPERVLNHLERSTSLAMLRPQVPRSFWVWSSSTKMTTCSQ